MTPRNLARADECRLGVQDGRVKTANVILDERGRLMEVLPTDGDLYAQTSG